MKFVQQLSKKFPQEVNDLINSYMNNYISEFQKSRDKNWNKMASFLNLFISANIGNYTFRSGALEINMSEDQLFSYIQQFVMPELQQPLNDLPILKATCIKFVYMFRNQIPDTVEVVQGLVGMFCNYLSCESIVN